MSTIDRAALEKTNSTLIDAFSKSGYSESQATALCELFWHALSAAAQRSTLLAKHEVNAFASTLKLAETPTPGPPGPQGPPGEDGKDGEDGERGPRPEHEWRGTQLRFERANGEWGEFTELRGPRGRAGANGASAGGGGGGVSSTSATFGYFPQGWT